VEAANRDDIQAFLDAARRQMGGRTLRHHAAQLAAAGRTSIEEAMRITNQFED
jgi:MSHA biogenesis protein MshE